MLMPTLTYTKQLYNVYNIKQKLSENKITQNSKAQSQFFVQFQIRQT